MAANKRLLVLVIVLSPFLIALRNKAKAQTTKLDSAKFEFEKYNEERKAKNEIIKSVITGLSLLIPLAIGIYTVRSQIKSARELKEEEIKNLFILKAAEIVMDARGAFAVKNKVEVLKALFGKQLPKDFSEQFEPKEHSKPGPGLDFKVELFKLINSTPEREKEIVDLWLKMFPGDRMDNIFPEKKASSNKKT